MRNHAGLVAIVFCLCAGPARAQEPEPAELRYDLRVDLPVAVGAGVLWAGSELLIQHLAAESCRWCAVDGLDASARNALKWSDTSLADGLSNASAYAAVPLLTAGLLAGAETYDGAFKKDFLVDTLILWETVELAGLVNQPVRFAVGRERPFVHALPLSLKRADGNPWENNTSFYSGHTSFVFSIATAAGTLAELRGYRLAPLVWAVGMPLAAATGYLRIAADKHYLTDVLTAAVMGSGIGFAVPYFVHGRVRLPVNLSVVPVEGGAMIAFSGS